MDSPDIQVKYQKLAAEYSKLRAGNQVLKKAIIEEQAKTAQLTDLLNSREQSLRKTEQEIESLNFRNQQLTKRLTLLQDDIDKIVTKGKKNKGKQDNYQGPAAIGQDVLTEELTLKIQENARLHGQLSDAEAEFKDQLSQQEDQLILAHHDIEKHKELVIAAEASAQRKLSELQSASERWEHIAQKGEAEIQSLKEELGRLGAESRRVGVATMVQGGILDNEVAESATVGSLEIRDLPDVTVTSTKEELSTIQLVKVFCELIDELCEGMRRFLRVYGAQLQKSDSASQVHRRLLEQLVASDACWLALSASYHQMADRIPYDGLTSREALIGLPQVSAEVTSCGTALRRLLKPWIHWLSEEGIRSGLGSPAFGSLLGHLVASWCAMSPYITSLANQSGLSLGLAANAVGRVLSMLNDRIAALHSSIEDVCRDYNQLPDGDAVTEISAALFKLSLASGQVSSVFRDQVLPCWLRESSYPPTPSSPLPKELRFGNQSGNALYMQDEVVHSPTECEADSSLAQQLAVSMSRLSELESEREHWRLEHQLLMCRFQKEQKKVKQLEKDIQGNNSSKEHTTEVEEVLNLSSCSLGSTSMIAAVDLMAEMSPSEREQEIRLYFTGRCSKLYLQLTSVISQAALYQNECESLTCRLMISDEKSSAAEQEVDLLRATVSNLKETLQTTSRNYEEQISAMSEHLADLNEKMTAQADMIERLQFELKSKRNKK